MLTNTHLLASSSSCSSSPMVSPSASSSSFTPPTRPFPPVALQDVPIPYILNQLHNLALNYWDKPQTADCTIVVPIIPLRNSARNTPHTPTSNLSSHTALGRHATEPALSTSRPTRMTSKLHLDYLLAQSSLFRDLFSEKPTTCQRSQHVQMPRILPSPPNHPVVHLPLPDPVSFPHLVHYMYFGTFEVLERALDGGEVRWEDVARNVEYLGMRLRVRRFLENWMAVQRGLPIRSCGRGTFTLCGSEVDDEESTDDGGDDCFSESEDGYSEMSDDDSDRSETDGSLETLVDDEPIAVPTKFFSAMDIDDEPHRGRSRTRISPARATHSPLRRH